jgi:hypothetical protein
MKELEDKYTEEINDFNAGWDEKLKTFQEEAKVQEGTLSEKHQKEMQELLQNVEIIHSKLIMKFSPQYIQLAQSEEKLVKQDK